MAADLASLYQSEKFADCRIAVLYEKKRLREFPAHLLVVCTGCAWFHEQVVRMSGSGPEIHVFVIESEDLRAAELMLECMYTNSIPDNATFKTCVDVLILSAKYRADGVRKLCIASLVNKAIPLERDEAEVILAIPESVLDANARLVELQHRCVSSLYGEDLEVAPTDKIKKLPYKPFLELLKKAAVAREDTVYAVAAEWILDHGDVSIDIRRALLAVVKIHRLSGVFLKHVVPAFAPLYEVMDVSVLLESAVRASSPLRYPFTDKDDRKVSPVEEVTTDVGFRLDDVFAALQLCRASGTSRIACKDTRRFFAGWWWSPYLTFTSESGDPCKKSWLACIADWHGPSAENPAWSLDDRIFDVKFTLGDIDVEWSSMKYRNMRLYHVVGGEEEAFWTGIARQDVINIRMTVRIEAYAKHRSIR